MIGGYYNKIHYDFDKIDDDGDNEMDPWDFGTNWRSKSGGDGGRRRGRKRPPNTTTKTLTITTTMIGGDHDNVDNGIDRWD